MRVLVAGPFPPSPDPGAAATLRTVQDLLGDGHAVEAVSPVPSAADHHAPLSGLKGALRLVRWAQGFDGLHLQVGRGLLFRPEMPQARRVLDSLALALALRRWRRTTADLGDLSDVPGGGGGLSGRLIWGAIDEIQVSSEPVRTHVVKVLHVPAAKVRVKAPAVGVGAATVPEPRRVPPAPPPPPWRATTPVDWAALTAEIQERAAAERARTEGRT